MKTTLPLWSGNSAIFWVETIEKSSVPQSNLWEEVVPWFLTLKWHKTSGLHFGLPVLSTHTIYNNYVEVLGKSWFVYIYRELASPDPFHPSHPVFTWKGLHQIVGQHATIALTSHIHTWMIDAQDQAHGLFAKQAPRTIKQQSIQHMTGWWLNQPIWKICSSNGIISPSRGEN